MPGSSQAWLCWPEGASSPSPSSVRLPELLCHCLLGWFEPSRCCLQAGCIRVSSRSNAWLEALGPTRAMAWGLEEDESGGGGEKEESGCGSKQGEMRG